MSRYVGITVLGDFILSEGVDPVLENVTAVGATAVALNPTVTAEAAEGAARDVSAAIRVGCEARDGEARSATLDVESLLRLLDDFAT